ncbi:DUF3562 domain-containing protein [Paraburkholderia caballeronis]|uniref:DUF3562 domain-containing protein n=1 Tax=Paraburkholderia caballeronis TaxID=416943 RepID=A0A1H7TSA7_9BURK|nr:DUF3562 domain-containing protein [Paraburkholderia caballeronis]PXW17639.1 uncharacterized protein DUF3562 [Paraburkholderia caballeronis]PXW95384.1 uncharacterized protein DUF3562 [Paraburkholderia caballeronis]RAJ91198.1 uncharacterized protein DUF3562 [Paraburkholderia caballeronis]SEE13219.1 Protein of unknown function [Paraburkholderia caballeronis]SEL87822.1 Protein of unknown function [Paraburkholderia caballeronis]
MPKQDVQQIVHAIAEETNTPEETVAQFYAEAVDGYRAGARILDYVPLFAARKVREALRHHDAGRK